MLHKNTGQMLPQCDNSASYVSDEQRWQALLSRDQQADGQFFYAVSSTGVFCRPSCPSRHPRPENVRYFETAVAAKQAGYRACKRCRPEHPSQFERHAAIIANACRTIAAAEVIPDLDELARQAGLSRFYFQRMFKAMVGLSPKEYGVAQRGERIRQDLQEDKPVTEAIYASGFNSSSRFYENSTKLLGMNAGRYRAGGKECTIRFALGQCQLGALLVAATEKGICTIALGDDPQVLLEQFQQQFPQAVLQGGDVQFEQWIAQVVAFIDRPQQGLPLPLDIRGTAFQHRVWQALRKIPPGTTTSYAELAQHIGAPKSARAVARACASNEIAIAIPCHRVIRSDGNVSGYRWGVERKCDLLNREANAQINKPHES